MPRMRILSATEQEQFEKPPYFDAVFLKVVQSFQNTSQREHKEKIYCERKICNANLTNLLSRLDDDVFAVMRKIRELTNDAHLCDADKIYRIRSLLKSGKDDQLVGLKAGLEEELSEGGYYKVLESRSLQLQTRVSPILKILCFQAEPGAITLMETIEHFKEKDGAVSSSAPLDFLEPQERKAVIGADGERFRTSLYKAFFIHTHGERYKIRQFESGTVQQAPFFG